MPCADSVVLWKDPEKLDARAARFGTNAASTKRKLDEPVDEAEAERRRKRAERFGTGVSLPSHLKLISLDVLSQAK